MRSLRQALVFDIRFGILQKWALFLPALLWGIFTALCVDTSCAAGKALGALPADTAFTLVDALLYAFHGGVLYLGLPGNGIWQIPVRWLLWHVYIALLVSLYPHQNLCGIGQQLLLRFRCRRYWWLGKSVWCLLCVCAAYGMMLIGAVGYTAVRGTLSPTVSFWMADVIQCPLWAANTALSAGELRTLVTLTVFASVTLCLWQIVLSLVLRPFGAFLAAVVTLTVSSFFDVVFLPPKYTIWIDSAVFGLGNADPLTGAIVCGIGSIAAVLIGGIVFSRYDILNKTE